MLEGQLRSLWWRLAPSGLSVLNGNIRSGVVVSKQTKPGGEPAKYVTTDLATGDVVYQTAGSTWHWVL